MAAKSSQTAWGGRKGIILIAHGRGTESMHLSRHLCRAGYRCDIVAEADQAVHAAIYRHYDVALLPSEMAQRSGMEVMLEIRSALAALAPSYQRLPILLILSAQAADEPHSRWAEGPFAYLAPSYTPASLLRMVDALMLHTAADQVRAA